MPRPLRLLAHHRRRTTTLTRPPRLHQPNVCTLSRTITTTTWHSRATTRT